MSPDHVCEMCREPFLSRRIRGLVSTARVAPSFSHTYLWKGRRSESFQPGPHPSLHLGGMCQGQVGGPYTHVASGTGLGGREQGVGGRCSLGRACRSTTPVAGAGSGSVQAAGHYWSFTLWVQIWVKTLLLLTRSHQKTATGKEPGKGIPLKMLKD